MINNTATKWADHLSQVMHSQFHFPSVYHQVDYKELHIKEAEYKTRLTLIWYLIAHLTLLIRMKMDKYVDSQQKFQNKIFKFWNSLLNHQVIILKQHDIRVRTEYPDLIKVCQLSHNTKWKETDHQTVWLDKNSIRYRLNSLKFLNKWRINNSYKNNWQLCKNKWL